MAHAFDPEEEWSESELFFESDSGLSRPARTFRAADLREIASVSPAPESTVSGPAPSIKVHLDHAGESGPSSIDDGPSVASRLPLDVFHPSSPSAQAGHKRGCAFGTPETTPRADKDSAQDFPLPMASCPGSVMEGAGRKLQGRDAVRFRRAIMRQTGFLENQSPLTEETRVGQSVSG
ncbi:hypothetical protein WJX73_000239 [Symbiochloris irregularis]|uniref:Uncharacterized protein n=1 Tax=Symbiochloris irregularis TaxID=706552 RepID=A0AAW1NIY6_9CHLO